MACVAAGILIVDASVVRPGGSGGLDADAFIAERRSPKVGMLPGKARMVLAAARRLAPLAALSGPDEDVGVSLGTLHGSMDVAEACLRTVRDKGFAQVVPSWYATGLPNATAAIVASWFGLGGPNLTCLGHQAGLDAIIFGCRQIAAGRARAMLAGGFDLPGTVFVEALAASGMQPAAAVVEPGAGLLWLARAEGREPGRAGILGWSQGFHAGADLADRDADLLAADLATACGAAGRPEVHVVRPAPADGPDRLAASAPIHLVERILDRGGPGLHAIVGKGYGPQTACLLVRNA